MSAIATLRIPRPPKPEPVPGRCEVCGCTDRDPCVVKSTRTSEVPCSWIDAEHTLCSRCWSPRRPTRRQRNELVRIQARYGRVRVWPGTLTGELLLELAAHRIEPTMRNPGKRGPTLTLLPSGRARGGQRPINADAYKGAGATNRLETGKRARGDQRDG